MVEIFDQIKEIEKHNVDFYKNVPDEEKTKINPFMLLKWMSYTDDAKQILHMNTLVNTKVFSLNKHKQLLIDLLVASCNGKHHYKWLKRDIKKSSMVVNMISDAHNCGPREASEILQLYSRKELLELCEEMNYDKADFEKIKKEINVLRV